MAWTDTPLHLQLWKAISTYTFIWCILLQNEKGADIPGLIHVELIYCNCSFPISGHSKSASKLPGIFAGKKNARLLSVPVLENLLVYILQPTATLSLTKPISDLCRICCIPGPQSSCSSKATDCSVCESANPDFEAAAPFCMSVLSSCWNSLGQ